MIHVPLWYSLIVEESALRLLMAWCLFGARVSANYMLMEAAVSSLLWRHKSWSSLIQMMACRLFGSKPLTKPILTQLLLKQCHFILTHRGQVTHMCVCKLEHN